MSLAEERKRKDGEENELLLQYQALKDAEDLLHEQVGQWRKGRMYLS